MTNAATEQITAKNGAEGAIFSANVATVSVAAAVSSAAIAVAYSANTGNPNNPDFINPFTVTFLSV
jgi:hypothetical protein